MRQAQPSEGASAEEVAWTAQLYRKIGRMHVKQTVKVSPFDSSSHEQESKFIQILRFDTLSP